MISGIICFGVLAVLVTALLKDLSDTYRGMICWTFSSIASVSSLIVYFAGSGGFRPDLSILISGLAGVGLITVIVLLIELFAPAKRLRKKERTDYDRTGAENALNIVMIIAAGAASAAACCCEYFSVVQFCIFGIIPAAAISIRQLSLYLYRVKQDTLTTDKASVRRKKLIKQLGAGKRSL